MDCKRYPPFKILVILALLCYMPQLRAQESKPNQTKSKKERKIVALPAISYTPETKFTLGVIGFYYMDFSRGEEGTRKSYLRPTLIYTTAKQTIIDSEWEVFGYKENWIFRGIVGYRNFPFRNYGLTNDAGEVVVEYDITNSEIDTLNYLRYTSKRLYFRPVLLKKLKEHFYLGLQYDLSSLFDYSPLSDSFQVISTGESTILDMHHNAMEGLRSGIGINMAYDSRDQAVYPFKGAYLQLGTYHFVKFLASDFQFSTFTLDARTYRKLFENYQHILAIRGLGLFSAGTSDQRVPTSALGEIGGKKQMMGYFRNTYLGNQTLILQAEYRMLLWKVIGATLIAGTADAFNDFSEPGSFRTAVGGGLRFLINKANRTYLRIDFAVGLHNKSGYNKRQNGIYFSMGESF